ncbi:unnamed protein product [Pylaiella littoralis]
MVMLRTVAVAASGTAAVGFLLGLPLTASGFMVLPPAGCKPPSVKPPSAHGPAHGPALARSGRRTETRRFMLPSESEDHVGGKFPEGAYERLQAMLERDGSTDYIFENNRQWVAESLAKDPDTFRKLSKSQKPRYMYIGCSDSRVPAQNMMGLNTGELFVLRNVANLCVNTDHSLLAALTYAVNVLEVTDIIVCGHYGCGGVKAAMENVDHGLLEHWLLNIRNVIRLHNDELQEISDADKRCRRLVELNVQESCINLFANPIVQKKQATSSTPKIHGWAYDVENGLLQELKIDFKSEIRKYREVYRLYKFPKRPVVEHNGAMTPRSRTAPSRVGGAGSGAGAVDAKVAQGWAKHVTREAAS